MKNKINYYPILITVVSIFFFICIAILFFIIINKNKDSTQYKEQDNKINIDYPVCPICPVCPVNLALSKKNKCTKNDDNSNNNKSSLIITNQDIDTVNYTDTNTSTSNRDMQVLNNPLFPPLNRTDRNTFNSVVRETRNRNINIPSKDINDSFHLVGYITNKDINGNIDSGNNNWKLMAREKDRNESEFYLIPTNNNYDIKIPIVPEIVIGHRIKDIYSIPKNINFNSPLLNKTSYEFVELPKSDFSSSYN